MLSHRVRERKYARATPVHVPVRQGYRGTRRKGERIEAGSVRIDSISRPIAIRGGLPEERRNRRARAGVKGSFAFVLVAQPENNRNDQCIACVYRRGTVR